MKRKLTADLQTQCLVLSAALLLSQSPFCWAQSSSGKVSNAKTAAGNRDLSREAKETIAWVAKNYRIEIVWKSVPYPIPLREERKMLEGVDPTKEVVEEALPGLKAALSKYPHEVPHAAGLRKIILGANLKASGVHIGGYSYPPSHALILEIENGDKRGFPSRTMHHEIFHLIDRAILGQFSKQDVIWLRLNGPAFRGYQMGDGWNWMANQQPGKARPTAERGFVSPYSMSSVQEDKAEVFGFLMDDPAALKTMADGDAIIRAKVERIKQLVRQASPKMDNKFFDKLAGTEKTTSR